MQTIDLRPDPCAQNPCEGLMPSNHEVLVVDDDPAVLDVVSLAMTLMGYRVTPALKPRIALEMLENKRFDLMITDLMMDDMDGIALMKESKKICPATGVLLMTGFYDPEVLSQAVKNEADDYLLKPFSIKELRSKAASCIAKRSRH
jgi:DNA-binding NtrC family response regulator